MARTDLTVQVAARTGLTPAWVAPNVAGNMFLNDGKTFLEVKNASGSPITVTLNIPALVDGAAVVAPTVSIPATTGDKIIGPFPANIYNQSDGKVYVDFSAQTSVTIAAVQVTL